MKTLSNSLIESLKTLGLTEYEAKVYSALVLFDRTEVKQIYEFLDAPKPSVYQSLKTLTDKGLVQVINAKPAIYRAMPPRIAIEHMTEIHKQAEDIALSELEDLEKGRKEREMPDVIWTLFGDKNVGHTIEEMMGNTKQSIKLVLPDAYLDYLNILKGTEVEVELIMFGYDPSIPEKYGLKYMTIKDAFGLDTHDLALVLKNFTRLPLPPENLAKVIFVLADDENAMYIPPVPGATMTGFTSKNPFVSALAGMVFKTFWERMPLVYPEQFKPGHHV